MKTSMMTPSEEMLLALLRSSLHEREPELEYFQKTTEKDWKECQRMAVAQGVMALAWDAVLRLPKHLQPPLNLKLTWAMAVERYEERYLRYCKAISELSALYAEHGIRTIQLKGVGFSTLYPNPSHREGGDIDIYTYSANQSQLTDAQANHLADTLMGHPGIDAEGFYYKHSNFHYKGIPIENHKCFLNIKEIKEAVIANEVLLRELKPEKATLAEGEILIPSATFNTLFIAFHSLQHYGSGLSLHQLCDWAMILKHYGLKMPKEMMHYERFMRGVQAMTLLCQRYLGISPALNADEASSNADEASSNASKAQAQRAIEAMAEVMFSEIMHPRYPVVEPVSSKMGIVVYKTKRLFYTHRLMRSVFHNSLFRRVWDSVIIHLRNPKSIFARNEK